MNVCFGYLAEVNCLRVKGPLWGTKRTSASGAPMSPNNPKLTSWRDALWPLVTPKEIFRHGVGCRGLEKLSSTTTSILVKCDAEVHPLSEFESVICEHVLVGAVEQL